MTRHGREADWKNGCRCDLCRRAVMRNQKLRHMRPGRVPTTDVVALITRLRAQGWTINDICVASNTSTSTIADALFGRRTLMRRDVAHRILTATYVARKPGGLIDATGTRRRLQALAAIGWSWRDLAGHCTLPFGTLSDIANGTRPTCTVHNATVVAELFNRLSGTPSSNRRARRRSQSLAWAPPLAWDDIDDPTETPIEVRRTA